MPDYTGNVSTIRSRANFRAPVWAGSIPQTVVLVGAVSATPVFPVTSVPYTVTSGTYTNVKADQRIVFFTAGGVRKGETRVRFKAAVTNISMPIAETSANTINLVSGDTFTVYEEWRLQDRLVSATSSFLKDTLIAVSDYPTNPPPVANAGGLWFGFVDSGQTYATVTFSASTSFTVDPDSSGTLTYLWDVVDGTITVGSTTTVGITVTFPVGFRHVTLTVTDADNGKSTVRYVPVRVYSSAVMPMRIVGGGINSTTKDGWTGEIEIARESAHDLATLPDGSLIVIFETAYYGTTQISYRSAVPNRSHILASLFLESETIDFQPGTGAVTFKAEGPLAVLKRTPALPQLMISGSTLDWQHVKSLTVNKAMWYIAFYHSTAFPYFDFVWVLTGTDLSYSRIAVENIDSIAGQLSDVAQSILADPTCDALGRILIIRNPNYLSTTDRAALVTTFALTTADIVDGSMGRLHHGSVKHVRGEGITSGSVPVFSNAGNAPSPIGTGSETLSRQIIVNQAELNVRTGKHFAQVNGLYNGQFVPQGVRLTVPDGYSIFDPAYREYVTLTLPASTNDRGVAFTTATHWTVDAISISFDGSTGGRDVELTVSHETDGADGVSYFPPSSAGDGNGSVNLPGTDFPPFDVLPGSTSPFGLTDGIGAFCLICSDSTLRRTTDFGVLPWDSVTPTGTITGTWQNYALMSNSPAYLGTGTTKNCLVATNNTNAAYKISDIFGAAPASTIPTGLSAVGARAFRTVDMSYAGAGTSFIVVSEETTTGTKIRVSTDGGATFGAAINVGVQNGGVMNYLQVSARTAGKAWAYGWPVAPATSQFLYVITASGGTVTKQTNIFDEDNYAPLLVPYHDPTETRIFIGWNTTGGDEGGYPVTNTLMRGTIDSGMVDIGAVVGGLSYGPGPVVGRFTMSSPNNESVPGKRFMYVGVEKTNTLWGVFYTDDVEAVTPVWTQVVAPSASCDYRRCVLLDPDGLKAVLFGINGAIGFWDKASGVVYDYRMNLIGSTFEVLGVAG